MIEISKEKQIKTRNVTYELSNDRNFPTKLIKKHVSSSSLAQFHLTNYDVL